MKMKPTRPHGNPHQVTSYSAKAVHFDGATTLNTPSLMAGGDTGLFASSIWLKMATSDLATGAPIWVVDPENVYDMSCGPQGIAPLPHPIWGGTFADNAGASDVGLATNGAGVYPGDAWVNILMSVKTDSPDGGKTLQVYLNDVPYTFVQADSSPAFLMSFTGYSFWFGGDNFGNCERFDVADAWLAPGQFIDFSIEANRRKFINANGKPVDLGIDGSIPTGTAPAIFFSGDSSSFGTNKGTGGNFTAVGSLTNASTSPSD